MVALTFKRNYRTGNLLKTFLGPWFNYSTDPPSPGDTKSTYQRQSTGSVFLEDFDHLLHYICIYQCPLLLNLQYLI